MKITLSEVRRFQELAGLTESQVERQLLATKPGDKVELTLDDDTKQLYVRVGTNSKNEPTFKMLKNGKPVSRESALAVSFIKAVKPIVTRQMTGDPDVDFMGEESLNEFDATSFFQGQMIQQAMQSAPQAMSEADKIITYVLMTVGIGAVAGGLAAVAKDKLGSLNPIPAIKQWWADRQKRKALEPIITKLKQDPEVMKYVNNQNMRGIQNVIKSKLTPEEQKYIGSLTRSTLSEVGVKM